MKNRVIFPMLLMVALTGLSLPAHSQITADKIAAHCAMDSNGTIDQYREYSVELAKTLSGFSPAALHRILGEYSVSAGVGESLNDKLDLKPIGFELSSSDLSGDALKELDKVVAFLNDNPTAEIEIEGHTSHVQKNNVALSESRAIAAKLYLAQNGIDPSRVTTTGYGATQTIADGDNNPENRRIEIINKG